MEGIFFPLVFFSLHGRSVLFPARLPPAGVAPGLALTWAGAPPLQPAPPPLQEKPRLQRASPPA
eukprot:scaffold28504_cov73-Isochrysis_galbana.AAC.1